METVSGYTIARGSDNYWRYVTGYDADNKPVLSSIRAHEEPEGLIKHISPLHDREMMRNKNTQEAMAAAPHGTFNGKVLFILVQFNDIKGTYTESEFAYDLTNRVKDYYYKASNGKVTLSPTNESFGTANNGVVGWLTLNYNHPNTGVTGGLQYLDIARDAILAADPYVDFAPYDTNHDGYVDGYELAVVVIVAGYEAVYSANYIPSVRAHKGGLGGTTTPYVDGVYVGDYHNEAGGYVMLGEVHQNTVSDKHRAPLGIMVHEMGHLIFVLPDLYDRDYSSDGIGCFCVMSTGMWTKASTDAYIGTAPVLPSAWVRSTFGWIDAYIAPGNLAFTAIGDSSATASNTVYKAASSLANEYFLVENRQPQGYDIGLEDCLGKDSGGLAIFHIDDNVENNETDTHRKVDLVEADGTEEGYGSPTDLWYAGNAKTFTDTSSPANSKLYNGSSSGVSITSISAKGIIMTASTSYAVQYALNVTKNGTGGGTVTSNFGGISCGTKCTANIDPNTQVTLTAVADSGSIFVGWSSNCSTEYGMSSVCKVTMSEAKNVTATFDTLICTSYTLTPTSKTFTSSGTSSGGNGNVSVTANTGCSWTAVSNVSGITIISGSSGNGNGTVAYTVAINSSTSQRSGTMTIAGQTFTVTQEGAPTCTNYTLTLTNKTFTSSGGSSSVGVMANTACSWTATSNDSWITITSGSSGNGNGTVAYTVAVNTSTSQRTGTMTIAGKTFTVTQEGQVSDSVDLAISKLGTGTGTVTSSDGKINCGGTCMADYTQSASTQVTLTATADSGSTFSGWNNDCTGTSSTCTVTMSAARNVTARFDKSAGNNTVFSHVRKDFDGDGKGDILWYNTKTGDVVIWLMNGLSISQGNYVIRNVPLDWQIKAIGDFNGDGRSDVLWQSANNGDVAVWLMDGASIKSGDYVVKGIPLDWTLKAVGDLNGDGKTDVLWQGTNNGNVAVWLMDGVSIKSGDYVVKGIPSDWTLKAVGDINRDGKSDMIWQAANGDVYVWLMDGSNITGSGFVAKDIPGNWQIKAIGDFDGDGDVDVLWQETASGDVVMWLMDGLTIGGNYVTRGLSGNWQILTTGDFNGDARSDVLLQDTNNGDVYIWLMDGANITGGGFVTKALELDWWTQ
ncbi:M6 family metalloprotease domain-containing protein [Candidatus Magnetobacterium casense]|uniref:M6 family metalloprotease domain-containing protein n=1 Tax=Candidatus Magnetobacterium casense TaxID=1455061 RepID=UPI000696B998|nr:M6 family metalloprotease domain-containing protein [Candidatus Magnetobacterium casensis]